MPGPSPTGPRPPPRSQRQPVAGLLTPAFCPYLVRVGIPPALLLGPVQPGVQLLDQAGVLLGMQRRRPHPRARILLQPLHRCGTAHTLRTRHRTGRPGAALSPARVHRENEAARAARPDRARAGAPAACAAPGPQRNPAHVPSTTHFLGTCATRIRQPVTVRVCGLSGVPGALPGCSGPVARGVAGAAPAARRRSARSRRPVK